MSACYENLFGPFCDVHKTEKAMAACCLHQNMLCFDCSLAHVQNVENPKACKVHKISERSEEEPDYVRLIINKDLERKRKIIDDYDEEAKKKQEELKKKIADASDKLLELVNKLKTKAMESLSDKAKDLLEKHRKEREAVTSFKQDHSYVLDATPDDESSKREQLSKLQDILKQLRDTCSDKKSTLEANFQIDTKIKQLLESASVKLGDVFLYEEDHYATIDKPVKPQPYPPESNSPDVDAEDAKIEAREQGQAHPGFSKQTSITSQPNPAKSKSLDVTPKKAKQEAREQGKEHPGFSKQISITSEEANESIEKINSNKRNSKKLDDKPKQGIFRGLFSKPKSDGSTKTSSKDSLSDNRPTKQMTKKNTKESDCQLEIYSKPSFSDRAVIIPRALINTAKELSGLTDKFEQLVHLKNGKLCLFSPQNKTLAVVELHESLPCKETFEENMNSLVKIGDDTIGLVCGDRKVIYIYKVEDKSIQRESKVPLRDCFNDITGFEFNGQDKFAISSPSQVLVVNKKGKVSKNQKYIEASDTHSTKIRTIYDFTKDVVYVLNTERATLKRINVDMQKPDWKIQMDPRLAVKNFSLYKDQICVVSKDKISQLKADDGTSMLQQDTSDLIKECLSICVTDNVIIVTSDPCDGVQNTKLAFKSF